jgi:diaminopimelate decarboxylase
VAGNAWVKQAPISLRVNPNVDAQTHPYISTGLKENKFGITHEDAPRIYQIAHDLPHLKIVGIDCHIGSQLTQVQPFMDALDKVIEMIHALPSKVLCLSILIWAVAWVCSILTKTLQVLKNLRSYFYQN